MDQQDRRILQNEVSVVASKCPVFKPVRTFAAPGTSLRELFNSFEDLNENNTKIFVNGEEELNWDRNTENGDLVTICQVPSDNVSAGLAILFPVLAIANIGIVAGYALYSMIQQPETDSSSSERLKRITGARNEAKPYEPIPVILGERRVVPSYAAQPYTYWVGNTQYLKMLLCVGHGPLEISDLKIGDNPIDNFSDVKYEVLDWYNTKSTSKIREIWNTDVQQDAINVELSENWAYVERAAPAGTNKITLNYTFPGGLFRITGGGSDRSIGAGIQFQYKVNGQWYTVAKVHSDYGGGITNRSLIRSGGSYWIAKTSDYNDNITKTNTSNRQYVSSYVERVENGYAYIRGQWDVNFKLYYKMTKKEFSDGISFTPIDPTTGEIISDPVPYRIRKIPNKPHKNQGAYSIQLLSASYELNSDVDDSYFGINETRGLYPVLIALDIRASDQLSNTIDNLSCKARSLVPNASITSDWKGWDIYSSSWKVSNNPAEMYKWVLQGHFNPVAISNDRIDSESLQDWYDTCKYRKWETNEIVNYDITLKDLLSNIAFTGRAFFTMREGKFGVIENIRKDNPVQIFTPKNSSGLTSRREFELETDGIKYTFANADYEDQEDEGYYGDPDKFYNSNINSPKPGVNITGRYDGFEVWGTTNPQLARKHARFAYFEKKLRREVYQLDVDIESLTARRGDKVLIASDTIDVGLGQGFIQEIEANRFRVDETINLTAGNTYSMTVRSVDGGIVIQTILAEYQGDGWWEYSLPSSVSVGDLVSYGNVLECLVTEIQYNDNYSATLTLVNYADDLYSVDFGALPTYESKLNPVRDRDITPLPPVINVSEGSYVFESNSLSVNVTQDANDSAILSSFTLQYRYETQNDEEDVESDIVWFDGGSTPANIGTFNIPVSNNQGNIIVVRAQAVNTAGVASAWTDEHRVVLDNNPAPDVEDFTITETVDEPKTPDAKWSTLTIEITPPADESRYLYAIAEYRQAGQEQWYRIGTLGWKNPNSIDVQVYADGRTYEVRIRSVSIYGVENTEGLSKVITTTNTADPSYKEGGAFEELPAPNVTGLELFEQGNDTEFTGKDAKFTWRKSSVKNWVDIGYEGLKGASSTALDQYFRDYQVDIIANNEIVRTEYVTDNSYIYTYEKNAEDYERRYGVPGAYRSFRISVIMRTRQNQQSERAAVLDVENPAPEPLSGIELIPGFKTITVRYERPTDLDYEGVEVWVGEEPGFDLNDDTLVYDGPDTEVTITGLESGKQYYIILRPYDAFGKVDIFSTELTTATIPIENTDIDSTPPDKVENVSLSTGVYDDRLQSTSYIDISWDSVTNVKIANYTLEINGDSLYTVAGTSFRYTNVIPGENYTFKVRANSFASIEGQWSDSVSINAAVSSVQPAVITNASVSGGLDKCIVTWTNPTSENFYSVSVHRGSTSSFTPSNANKIASVVGAIGSSQTYIDSDVVNDVTYHYKLVPETLGGVSGAEVYAGSAAPNRIESANVDLYVGNAAFGDAKIANLDAAKITTGTLNADRIGANTITAGKLDISQLSAITADMGSITAGTITSGTTSTGVQLSTTNGIRAWSSGTQTLHIKPDGTGYIGASQDISWDGSGNVSISGELGAGSIFTNGRVTSTVGNINVGLGPIDIDGTAYLMWGYDASASVGNKLKFGIDELGNAYFKGDITGATGTFSGQLNVNNNFIVDASGNVDSSGTFRFGGGNDNYINYNGSKLIIDTDNFSVDSSGNATFSGELQGAAGTFSGTLSGADGTFSGDITASDITGSTIEGSTFRTASSGQRVEINSSTNSLKVYDDNGYSVAEIGETIEYFIGAFPGYSRTAYYGRGTYANRNVAGLYAESELGNAIVARSRANIAAIDAWSDADNSPSILGHNQSYTNTDTPIGVYGWTPYSPNGVGVYGNGRGYDFYAAGPGVNYGPFTGAHDALISKNTNVEVGMLVSVTGKFWKNGISQTVPEVIVEDTAEQKRVYGVVSRVRDNLGSFVPAGLKNLTEDEMEQIKSEYKLLSVNAVGEGQLLVCDEGGDIEIGDFVCSSSRYGLCKKYTGDDMRYVVARVLENVNWEEENDDKKLVACIYLCG